MSKIYWGKSVNEAIIQYQHTNDVEIFHKTIYPAFHRLVCGIVSRFFQSELNNTTLIESTITKLFEVIQDFDSTRGKSYSFFGTVAKHYIQAEHKKSLKNDVIDFENDEENIGKIYSNNFYSEMKDFELLTLDKKVIKHLKKQQNKYSKILNIINELIKVVEEQKYFKSRSFLIEYLVEKHNLQGFKVGTTIDKIMQDF